MKITVAGLWHLGSVTAACMAELGHQVIGFDSDTATIEGLKQGRAPLFEPDLDALIGKGLASGLLHVTADPQEAFREAELIWITHDTPVDDEDRADIDSVIKAIESNLPFMADRAVVLVSSQLPVGSIGRLERIARASVPHKCIHFAVSPENLRLGKAIDVFMKPDRIIVGCRTEAAREVVEKALAPLSARIEWMSVEAAEVTKHAINAFLALSVSYANELATLCERVGADATEVERGLKTEMRIGPKAYLSPGGAFAGGTLARDLLYLEALGDRHQLPLPLIRSVRTSNDVHKSWIRHHLQHLHATLAEVKIAIWGMTYKPGTDTLRRSLAVELCDWLIGQKASIHIHDPAVTEWPHDWQGQVTIHVDAMQAARNADILVIGTPWPDFHSHSDDLADLAATGLVLIDQDRHLKALAPIFGAAYHSVGVPLPGLAEDHG